MYKKEFRLFVADLPSDVTSEKLKKLFIDFGEIKNVDLKKKVDVNEIEKKFAYVKILTSDAQLNQCIRQTNGVDLNGHKLNVQLAKESFLERLNREREENQRKKNATPQFNPEEFEEPSMNAHSKPQGKKKIFFEDEENAEVVVNPTKLEYEEENEIVPKKKKDKKERKASKLEEEEKVLEEIVKVENDVEIEEDDEVTKKRKQSEEQRLASMKKRDEEYRKKQKILRNALKIIDIKPKKTTFDDSGVEETEAKKIKLFDDDEEVALTGNEFSLEKTQIAVDERFQLTEKFMEKPEETKPKKKVLEMKRYDPSTEQYLQENSTVKAKKKKQEKSKPEIVKQEPIPVSPTIFHRTEKNLKEILQEKTEFSLLAHLGRAKSPEIKPELSEIKDEVAVKKKTKIEKVKLQETAVLKPRKRFFAPLNEEELEDLNNFWHQEFVKKDRAILKKIVKSKIRNVARKKKFTKKNK